MDMRQERLRELTRTKSQTINKNSHSPNSISSSTCSGEATISSLKPATNIPRFMWDGDEEGERENWIKLWKE